MEAIVRPKPATKNVLTLKLRAVPLRAIASRLFNELVLGVLAVAVYQSVETLKFLYSQGRRNFRDRNLAEANLAGVDMPGIDLTNAYLKGADLTGANLAGARLVGADLTGATLTATQLSHAMLEGAALKRTNLHMASLHHATYDRLTSFQYDFSPSLFGMKKKAANALPEFNAECLHTPPSSLLGDDILSTLQPPAKKPWLLYRGANVLPQPSRASAPTSQPAPNRQWMYRGQIVN